MVRYNMEKESFRYRLLVGLLLCLLSARGAALAADAPSPAKLRILTNFFENEVSEGRIPGAVILIQQHGRPVYQKTFGVRDVKTIDPMTPDTIFALMSMTKPITSVAAMMLVDDGRLSLDDPIAKYIPGFADRPVGVEEPDSSGKPALRFVPAERPPTIRDLLQQTSGISSDYVGGWVKRIYLEAHLFDGRFNNAEFADRVARLPLTRQPGTFWRYGHSTDVLGRIIEIASGETLYQFMKQRIFDPLGMVHTKFVIDAPEELALTAEPLPGDGHLVYVRNAFRSRPEFESGGAGLFSTAIDYGRFAQMLLNGGELDGKRYLTPSSFEDMTTDHVGPGSGIEHDYFYFPGDGFGFGFGLGVRTGLGETNQPGSIGELKWDSGSGTYVGIDPKLDMIYILMEQTDKERGRIRDAFRKLVYDAFSQDANHPVADHGER
jgi:CubicO group peptidase (beta-lactamase class C family)